MLRCALSLRSIVGAILADLELMVDDLGLLVVVRLGAGQSRQTEHNEL